MDIIKQPTKFHFSSSIQLSHNTLCTFRDFKQKIYDKIKIAKNKNMTSTS